MTSRPFVHRLLLTLGLLFALPLQAASDSGIDAFFAGFTDRWVALNPNLATSSGYFAGPQQEALERELTPLTREYRLQLHALAREGLATLAGFDRATLNASQLLAAEVMQAQLEALLAEEPWLDYILFPLDPMLGANAELPVQLTVVHPLDDAADARNYVARLAQMGERMQEAVAETRRRAERGIVLPRFILDNTLLQMERFSGQPAAVNPLVTTLADKSATLPFTDPAERDALLAEATRIVETEVYPAWQDAIAALRTQLPQANDDAGLWRFPNGAEIYANQLRVYTTTDLSADQIHDIGLAEVARIETEMDVLLRQLGYTEGSIDARTQQLSADQAWPATDAGRADMQAFIETSVADALERSALLFDRMPQAAVIAQPYPEFLWNDSAASYTPPPLDGSRPGVFQYPLRDSYLTEFGLRTLVYHETVPGHHFQIALAAEDPTLPRFMQMSAFGYISASVEGWALYAERLAAEEGWYGDDVAGLIGQLNDALFRAKRLVVDTGLHAKGWTRQQAIDYGIEPSEVDRYIIWPGQACSYMIGQLKLVELRETARAALGERFSIRDFHNVVLGTGGAPLSVLEAAVQRHIDVVLVTGA
jgi:uncharacterized protein (DUF885 family)